MSSDSNNNDNNITPDNTQAEPEIVFNINPDVSFYSEDSNPVDLSDNALLVDNNQNFQNLTTEDTTATVQKAVNDDANTDDKGDQSNVDTTDTTDTTGVDDAANTEPKLDAEGNPIVPDAADVPAETDYSGFSTTAKFAVTVKDLGIDLYDDKLPEDLKPETFVQDLGNHVSTSIDTGIQNGLKQMGTYAQYVNFIAQGGKKETITPAIVNQKYADVNIEDPAMTEDGLKELVKAMYTKQGMTPEQADEVIGIDVEKDRLKDKGIVSKEYHSQYINSIKQAAINNFKLERDRNDRDDNIQRESFANVLKTGSISGIPIDNTVASNIFSFMYNKNQPLTYPDENGKQKREMVSNYEIKMIQAVNDPEKLALLSYLVMNDFKLDGLAKIAKSKVNTSIYKAIEGTSSKQTSQTNQSDNDNTNNNSNEVVHSFTM